MRTKTTRLKKTLTAVLALALVGAVVFEFARSSYFDEPNPAPGYMQRAPSENYAAAKQRASIADRIGRAANGEQSFYYGHPWSVTSATGKWGSQTHPGGGYAKDDWRNMVQFLQEVLEYKGNSKWVDCMKVPSTMPSGPLRDYVDNYGMNIRRAPSERVINVMNDYLTDISDEITFADLTPMSAANC